MKDKLKKDEEYINVEESINVFLAISGFVAFLICAITSTCYFLKTDYAEIESRFGSMLLGLTILNMCSAYICINWEEDFSTKLCKYIIALSIPVQMLLILLCKNEWTMTFVRVMAINIICYIPFAWSFLNRLLDTNTKKSPALELIGIGILLCVAFLDYKERYNQLTMLSLLSIATLLPNAIVQLYYYITRRNRNE